MTPFIEQSVKGSRGEARRQKVARRIANGDKITGIQVRNQHVQRVQEITQNQALSRDGRSR